MAQVIGNTTDAGAYQQKYENAKKAIYANYWDESKKQFIDPLNEAPPSTLNALALELRVLNETSQTPQIASTAKAIAGIAVHILYRL